MKRITLRSIGKVIYCYMLPAMGTALLIIAMFHREMDDSIAMSSESDTMLKVTGLILCASTYWAAFMYWNSFVREFQVVMEQDEFDAYAEHLYNMQSSDVEPEPEMEEVYPVASSRVELDSPIKGLCLPFVCEYTESWQKERGGWGNGYVLISSDHPASGLGYDDEQTPYFEEELTFAGQFSTEMLESCGIDKDIAEDADKYWVFGFDTMHYWNNRVKNDANWVASKAVQLAAEFKKAYVDISKG